MNCSVCSKNATKLNKAGLPVCSVHSGSKIKKPLCPNCGLEMRLRQGRYGPFWGCLAFPMCDGIKKI